MKPKDFYLSNSMLRDWEQMCPREWKSRWIDKNPAYQYESDAMHRGNVFECLTIGMSVGQKVTQPSETLKKSVFMYRIRKQSEAARKYLNMWGGKIAARQEYLYGTVTDSNGVEIKICGNLDIRYAWADKPNSGAVIDLKFTGDIENEFGKFAWGAPDKMDMSQLCHYKLLHQLNFPEITELETHYWVFDHQPELQKKLLKVNISDGTLWQHIERVSVVYQEIQECLLFDVWDAKNTFDNCSKCKIKCPNERVMPEFITIEK